jgi:hypothetical protein
MVFGGHPEPILLSSIVLRGGCYAPGARGSLEKSTCNEEHFSQPWLGPGTQPTPKTGCVWA